MRKSLLLLHRFSTKIRRHYLVSGDVRLKTIMRRYFVFRNNFMTFGKIYSSIPILPSHCIILIITVHSILLLVTDLQHRTIAYCKCRLNTSQLNSIADWSAVEFVENVSKTSRINLDMSRLKRVSKTCRKHVRAYNLSETCFRLVEN